eukprot:7387275-Prymnesium_polylepis.1
MVQSSRVCTTTARGGRGDAALGGCCLQHKLEGRPRTPVGSRAPLALPTLCAVGCAVDPWARAAEPRQQDTSPQGQGHGRTLDDGADATPGGADHHAPRVVVLDLARGVRPVAQLGLEPLDAKAAVARAVGQPARHELCPGGGTRTIRSGCGERVPRAGPHEARYALARLRQREEAVRHGRGREPLVADERELAALTRVGRVHRRRARRVGAHVGATLLLGHGHAERRALLGQQRHVTLVVPARAQPRQPRAADSRPSCGCQGRRTGKRHGNGAADARVELVHEVHKRSAHAVCARATLVLAPREASAAALESEPH